MPPKAPPFPMRAPHVDTHAVQSSSRKSKLEQRIRVSGPQCPHLRQDPGRGGSRRLGASWARLPQLLALPWLPSKHFPPPTPASPSPSDQALPGTAAPGCHGNGFQAAAQGFLIGWLSLQAKVTPRVTSRSRSCVSSRSPGTYSGRAGVEPRFFSPSPLWLLRA